MLSDERCFYFAKYLSTIQLTMTSPAHRFKLLTASFSTLFLTGLLVATTIAFTPQVFAQVQQQDMIDSGAEEGAIGRNDAIGIPSSKRLKKGLEEADSLGKVNIDSTTYKIYEGFSNSIIDGVTGFATADGGQELGAVQSLGSYITFMYRTPAADTQTYVADLLDSAGVAVAQPAYAQGVGFSSLTPILDTWKIFRNIAYLMFVLIFLVIGFMIMFRQKIGGQTVVTAQQAIPNIIVALITVTFSYAIAGLLIDAMYLLMFLMLTVFGVEDIISFNLFEMGAKLVAGGGADAFQAVSGFIDASIGGGLIDKIDFILAGSGGLLAALVIAIAIMIGIFRLFFELLKTYISIIISIALAPLLLMLGAIPGRNTFGGWLKGLVGNLAAFPVVLLILIIYHKLTGSLSGAAIPSGTGIEQGGFSPPFIVGIAGSGLLSFLLGLGMILIMTDLVIQAKKAMGAGGGVFEQFGQNVADALKKGYKGEEIVPGLGFTAPKNWGKDTLGGFSGENATKKLAELYGGVGRGVIDLPRQAYIQGSLRRGFGTGFSKGFARTAKWVDDKHVSESDWAKRTLNEKEDEKGQGKNQVPA